MQRDPQTFLNTTLPEAGLIVFRISRVIILL
jgi:hypothetical protein